MSRPRSHKLSTGLTITVLTDGTVKLYSTAKRSPRHLGVRAFFIKKEECAAVGGALLVPYFDSRQPLKDHGMAHGQE